MTVADACDQAIQQAKREIRGSEDEFIQRDPTGSEPEFEAFGQRAAKAGELCVSDSFEGKARCYRIRREKHHEWYRAGGGLAAVCCSLLAACDGHAALRAVTRASGTST